MVGGNAWKLLGSRTLEISSCCCTARSVCAAECIREQSPAGSGRFVEFGDPAHPPSGYKLAMEAISPIESETLECSRLVDFGKETFGNVRLHGIRGRGRIGMYYGESKEEALSADTCKTYWTIGCS